MKIGCEKCVNLRITTTKERERECVLRKTITTDGGTTAAFTM